MQYNELDACLSNLVHGPSGHGKKCMQQLLSIAEATQHASAVGCYLVFSGLRIFVVVSVSISVSPPTCLKCQGEYIGMLCVFG